MLVFFLTINQDKKKMFYILLNNCSQLKSKGKSFFFLNDRTQKELTKYMNKIINTTMCPVTQWIRYLTTNQGIPSSNPCGVDYSSKSKEQNTLK